MSTTKIDKALLDPRKTIESGEEKVTFRSFAELAAMRDLSMTLNGGGFKGHGPIRLSLSKTGLGGL